jgi:phosphomannomutase
MSIRKKIEPIEIMDIKEENRGIIKLDSLTEDEKEVLNPQVPYTSGIRMLIYEKRDNLYYMPKKYQYMFFRAFKALSIVMKEELNNENPNILLVTDDRPSANYLLEYCAKIFTYEGYKLYFQEITNEKSKKEAENTIYYSRMSSPYGAASVALIDHIHASIIITASHNSLLWNGIKFYIDLPMPISGDVMKRVSELSIKLEEIVISNNIEPKYIDVDRENNNYTIELIKKIIDISALKSKKIVFWPYLGRAPELQALFSRLGAEIILIEKDMHPPNPTINLDQDYVQLLMNENNAEIAVLVDSDRDRVVFVLNDKNSNSVQILSPNEIYTAMHNILTQEYGAQLINVRTIPSDPRNDENSLINFVTGVGYKHLGLILYSTIDMEIESTKFNSGIIYYLDKNNYHKLQLAKEIKEIVLNKCKKNGKYIMVLWEESGGHTFNLLEVKNGKISSPLPIIADKYIAPAICILCGLITGGHDIVNAIDRTIIGKRTAIEAQDEKKLNIIKYFAEREGQEYDIDGYKYKIGTFETVEGKKSVIHLRSDESELYIRPSGTGPNVRIYIFGPKKTAKKELETVRDKIEGLFN